MTVEAFSPAQQDGLQEIANLAMGRAGAVLAEMLDAYIELSVPRVAVIGSQDLGPAIEAFAGAERRVAAVRQSFLDGISGEALAVYADQGCRGLADLLGHRRITEAVERELLLDVSTILLGSVLRGLGEHTDTRLTLCRPALLAISTPASKLLPDEALVWDQALMLQVHFRLQARGFTCQLFLLMPERGIETMRRSVDRILANLG